MNPSTMTRQELEDTVVILQHICLSVSKSLDSAMSELRYGIPMYALKVMQDAQASLALSDLTPVNAPRSPLEASRIDQNHSTNTEAA